jgi:hypothetical protein
MAGFEDAMFESVVLGVRSRIIDFKEVGMRYGRADNQKCGGHMRARMLLGKQFGWQFGRWWWQIGRGRGAMPVRIILSVRLYSSVNR